MVGRMSIWTINKRYKKHSFKKIINCLRFGALIFLPFICAIALKKPKDLSEVTKDAIRQDVYAQFNEENWEAVQAAQEAIEAESYNYFNVPVFAGTFIVCLFAIWLSYGCPLKPERRQPLVDRPYNGKRAPIRPHCYCCSSFSGPHS